jgi:segregation and condensation protein A
MPISTEYQAQVGEFSGPLEKLLELIEGQKLDISEVSLAKVTDQFLQYLDQFKAGLDLSSEEKFRIDLRVLADFISVASKLIFLKSKYLLPGLQLTQEEEADIKDLEDRLKIYQELKPAIKVINQLWLTSHKSYSRGYFLGKGISLLPTGNFFYPGNDLTAEALNSSLANVLKTIETYELETETIKEKIVTLEEKINEVLARIQKEGDMHFNKLSDTHSRGEMVVAFLAVLHLAREQLVLLEQLENFSDIIVKKNEQ